MTKSKLVGRRTEYSRPLESKGDLIVPNRELTVEPAVPDSHSLTENADASALGVVARFKRAGHPPVSVWFDAEVLRAKAIAAGLVDQLIEDGKIVIGCAIGYTAGKVVVAPAA